MTAIVNRILVGVGLVGSLAMLSAMVAHMSQPVPDLTALCAYWLTFFAVLVSLLATCFSVANIDATGINHEGRITSIIPIALAACGLALTVRWSQPRLPFAVCWLALQVPGVIVGLRTASSTLQQSLRRTLSAEDRLIAVQWELKLLTNRVNLLEQLLRPGGPDPAAQKKLATTGNTVEKYYDDTKAQLEKFLDQVEDEPQRATVTKMLTVLQQLPR